MLLLLVLAGSLTISMGLTFLAMALGVPMGWWLIAIACTLGATSATGLLAFSAWTAGTR